MQHLFQKKNYKNEIAESSILNLHSHGYIVHLNRCLVKHNEHGQTNQAQEQNAPHDSILQKE